MLSMMWQRSFDGVSVHAYAYASPCVVDLRTARDVAPCITTVVLGEFTECNETPIILGVKAA